MALRRNRKIIGEIKVERRGKWTHAEATLCNGGIIFASARRSRKETCSHKLGRQVVLGRPWNTGALSGNKALRC